MAPRRLKPRRSPVQERSRETVAAVLDAAAQVFERHGYAAGTTNRIAERAGVSIGSLYQYFPNKETILIALVERHMDEGYERLLPLAAELSDEPPPLREGLERLVATMVALHADAPGLHRVLFEECPRSAPLQERFDAAQKMAVEVIAAWLSSRPEASVPDPALAAEMVASVVEGIAHGVVIHPQGTRKPDAYAAETVAMLFSYLTAPPGACDRLDP